MILGQIRCEEALQVVPACRLCYMKTAPNCQNTRPTCHTPQYKTSIEGPFHFRQNNHVLLLSQNVNFSLSGHYNQGDADVVIEKGSLPIFCNDLVLAQSCLHPPCLALTCRSSISSQGMHSSRFLPKLLSEENWLICFIFQQINTCESSSKTCDLRQFKNNKSFQRAASLHCSMLDLASYQLAWSSLSLGLAIR